MTPVRAPRWALSFADLCLLLLAFFVLLQSRNGDRAQMAASMRAAFGDAAPATAQHYPASSLFEPGEAVLKPEQRARFVALGRHAAAIRITGDGMDPANHRLDAWELAAARVAAVARAVQAGGVPESRIEILMPRMDGRGTGQRISVLPRPL
jgi:flagellar motor protein MotB